MTQALEPGAVFGGRYEVVRRVGAGGMGAVYEVVDRGTRRRRALKVLLPVLVSDPDARARFAQEATITAELVSENLVEVFDAGVDSDSGCPFIVLELLRGESLGDALARRRRFAPAEALELLRQVARALDRTHAAGIVHRDLKPDNLFTVQREDGTPCVKILDFGIAKMVETAGKSRNTVNIGTPLYMAPEQLDGSRLDGRADLYALAHIAFELLTGESYWEPEVRALPSTLALIAAIQRGCLEAPSERARRTGVALGASFDAWFLRSVAREPQRRFASAIPMVEALAAALGLPPNARAATTAPRTSQVSPVADDDTWDTRATARLAEAGATNTLHDGGPLSGVSRHRWTGQGHSPARAGLLLGLAAASCALLVGVWTLVGSGTPPATSAQPSSPLAAASNPTGGASTSARTPVAATSASATVTASASASMTASVMASSRVTSPSAATRTTPGRPGGAPSICQREPRRCR